MPERFLARKGRPGGKQSWWWQPSRLYRSLGFKDRRLSDDEAIAAHQARELNAEADAYRDRANRGEVGKARPGTLNYVIGQYQLHDDFLELREATRRSYQQALQYLAAELGEASLRSITPPVVQALKRTLKATPWQGNSRLRMLRILFSFARREGWHDGSNPASAFRQLKTQPRQAYWSHDDEAAFLAVCRPSLRLPFLVALYMAQREFDVLRLPWAAYAGGSITFRQSKTGAAVSVPCVAVLQAEIEATPRRSPIMCCDHRGLPWLRDTFCHAFAEDRDKAGLRHLRFSDTRRSGVVRLAEVGCTLPEITAVSGHRIERANQILETYLPRTARMASAAIAKLERR